MRIAGLATTLLLAAGVETTPVPTTPGASPPPAAAVPAPPAAPEKDPAALALVKRMSDRLRQAKAFTLKARISLELPVGGGGMATFFTEATAAVQRPNQLAAWRTGDLPEIRFAYDGKTMSVLAPGNQQWGTTSAPPTIDAMLLVAFEQGGLSFPFDEVLVTDPYAAITKDLVQASLVGQSTIGGRKADHVLLTSPALELQIWLDPVTALPVREAVVYADHPLRPHFSVDYTEWKLDPKLATATFALPRPAAAAQVEFRTAAAAFR